MKLFGTDGIRGRAGDRRSSHRQSRESAPRWFVH